MIVETEKHKCLKGQIKFLLDISDITNDYLWERFKWCLIFYCLRRRSKKQIENESNTNKQKLKDDYTFLIQGNSILVTHHVYTFKGILDGRIYFYPCTETGKGYICSLTRKIENI